MTAQISRDLLQRLRALLKSEGHSTRVGLTVQDDAVLMRVPKSAATACARVRALGGERLVLELARGESVWIRRLGPVGMDRLLAALPSFLPWALVKLGQARCPACGQLRTLARESYLQEAAWQLTRAHPTGFPAGWHEARAREPGFRWACCDCIDGGAAVTAQPEIQVVGLRGPALAYFSIARACRQCGQRFTFTAVEQKAFYEGRRRSLESLEQRCAQCRQPRRGRRD